MYIMEQADCQEGIGSFFVKTLSGLWVYVMMYPAGGMQTECIGMPIQVLDLHLDLLAPLFEDMVIKKYKMRTNV